MRIETFIITWNRADCIHLTVNYYLQFGSVTVFDNFSDDGTRDICEKLGAEVKLFGRAGVLDDQAYIDIKNTCWKKSNADYVIVCDDDEILYHEYLKLAIGQERIKGTTIFKTQGYSMHSDTMPVKSWLEVKTGRKDHNYSKLVIFDPSKITAIDYVYGCHEARPKGTVRYSDEVLPLLHYRSIGGVDRLIARHHQYQERKKLSAVNMRWGLGSHYDETDDLKRKQWKESLEKSVPLFGDGMHIYQGKPPHSPEKG